MILRVLLVLTIIVGYSCQEHNTTKHTTTATGVTKTKKPYGWNDDKNYEFGDNSRYNGYGDDGYDNDGYDNDRYDNGRKNNDRGNKKQYGKDGYDNDRYDNDRDNKKQYGKDGYDNDRYDNDRDNKNQYGNDRYNDGDDNYGYDASEYRSSREKRVPDSYGNMNIYIRPPSKEGKRKKPQKLRFPVHQFRRGNFPRFPQLISFLPWLPIFADKLTKQTIIFSPIGGIYIIPPLINFYGKMFSVAELIASGYASLVSSGAPPPAAVEASRFVRSTKVVGPGIPADDPVTGGFVGGLQTQFSNFESFRNVKRQANPPSSAATSKDS